MHKNGHSYSIYFYYEISTYLLKVFFSWKKPTKYKLYDESSKLCSASFNEAGKTKTSLAKYSIELNDFAELLRPHRQHTRSDIASNRSHSHWTEFSILSVWYTLSFPCKQMKNLVQGQLRLFSADSKIA